MTRRIAALVLALLPTAALAQTSFPMITHVNPVAVQRGHTSEVTVEGQQNFAGAYKFLTEGAGLSAEIIPGPAAKGPQRSVKLKITAAADAVLGVREFRLATSLGLSSLGQIVVVDEPVI